MSAAGRFAVAGTDGDERAAYLVALVISLLLHLLVLIVAGLVALAAPEPPEEQPVEVPLTFVEPEPPPEPQATAPEPAPAEPPPDETQPARDESGESPDSSLLGFSSPEGEVEAQPLRPQGPEDEIHAPPKPEPGPEDAPVSPRPTEEPEPAEPEPPSDTPAESTPSGRPPLREPEPAPEQEPGAPLEAPARAEDAPRAGEAPLPFPPVPEREPTPEQPRRSTPERPRVRRAPDFDVPATGGFWADNLRFDSRDYDWSDYSTKLYFAVYRAWLRELHGRIRRFERDQALLGLPSLDAEVTIHVTLHRDGSVSDLRILDASVLPTLDDASAAAIQRAVIPPLPEDFPRDAEGVTWRFRISRFETARQMERQLEWMRYRGEF
ncbi:MAG: hypothetical protein Kow0062_01670 [Acidobacteriota bacterium]